MRLQRNGSLKSFELYCTVCDWKKVVQVPEVVEWHLRKCPSCGKSIIVTDDDMAEYRRIVENDIRAFGRTKRE